MAGGEGGGREEQRQDGAQRQEGWPRSHGVRPCWSCKEFRFHSRANRRQTTLVAEQRMERQVGDDGSLGQVTPLLLYPPGPPRNPSQPLISSLLICKTELAMVSSSQGGCENRMRAHPHSDGDKRYRKQGGSS